MAFIKYISIIYALQMLNWHLCISQSVNNAAISACMCINVYAITHTHTHVGPSPPPRRRATAASTLKAATADVGHEEARHRINVSARLQVCRPGGVFCFFLFVFCLRPRRLWESSRIVWSIPNFDQSCRTQDRTSPQEMGVFQQRNSRELWWTCGEGVGGTTFAFHCAALEKNRRVRIQR